MINEKSQRKHKANESSVVYCISENKWCVVIGSGFKPPLLLSHDHDADDDTTHHNADGDNTHPDPNADPVRWVKLPNTNQKNSDNNNYDKDNQHRDHIDSNEEEEEEEEKRGMIWAMISPSSAGVRDYFTSLQVPFTIPFSTRKPNLTKKKEKKYEASHDDDYDDDDNNDNTSNNNINGDGEYIGDEKKIKVIKSEKGGLEEDGTSSSTLYFEGFESVVQVYHYVMKKEKEYPMPMIYSPSSMPFLHSSKKRAALTFSAPVTRSSSSQPLQHLFKLQFSDDFALLPSIVLSLSSLLSSFLHRRLSSLSDDDKKMMTTIHDNNHNNNNDERCIELIFTTNPLTDKFNYYRKSNLNPLLPLHPIADHLRDKSLSKIQILPSRQLRYFSSK